MTDNMATAKARMDAFGSSELDVPLYLIWSNQHGMWWRPDEAGYTRTLEEAGRYSRADAERIVNAATVNGQLTHRQAHAVTGVLYDMVDEWMVLAPESTEAIQ